MSRLYKFIFINLFFIYTVHSIPVASLSLDDIYVSSRDLSINTSILLDKSVQPLRYYDYISDAIGLYGLLWLNITYALPLRTISIANNSFSERILLEPFANDKFEVLFEPLRDKSGTIILDSNGNPLNFPNKLFVSKNIVEPLVFYSYGLYLRAKNYHPALYIGVLFSLSFLYEFTVKPFFMEASFEQLIKNPSVGIIASLVFDEFATYLLTSSYKALHVMAYILNPFKLLPTSKVKPLLFFEPYKQAISLELSFQL